MHYIHKANLKRLDFRMLELFQAIRQCKSVTDAALLLEIPQPTAPRWLNRLRSTVDDELFVRSAHGMEPTPRALEISKTVEEILRLGNALEMTREFNPETADREYVVAGSDVGQWVASAAFYSQASALPGIRLKTVTTPKSDLPFVLENGRRFGDRSLSRASAGYQGANAISRSLSLPLSTRSPLRAEPPHRMRVTGESYLVGQTSIWETGLIFTCPAVGIWPVVNRLGLAGMPPPFELPPFDVKQYWHVRNDADPAHRWLRSHLYEALVGRTLGQ